MFPSSSLLVTSMSDGFLGGDWNPFENLPLHLQGIVA